MGYGSNEFNVQSPTESGEDVLNLALRLLSSHAVKEDVNVGRFEPVATFSVSRSRVHGIEILAFTSCRCRTCCCVGLQHRGSDERNDPQNCPPREERGYGRGPLRRVGSTSRTVHRAAEEAPPEPHPRRSGTTKLDFEANSEISGSLYMRKSLETRLLQAMGQLHSTCTVPTRRPARQSSPDHRGYPS
jgi:hypothetical protein